MIAAVSQQSTHQAGERNVRASWVHLFVLLLILTCGCNIPWPEEFGEITGTASNRSLNGLGAHRRMWELAGAKVLTPQKLSARLSKIDTIVLVGSSYRPPGQLARDWLEKWLQEETGRTVVYFGRDFDAVQLYREETIDEVALANRERAQTQLSSREATNYIQRSIELPESTFCRWFFLRVTARPAEYATFKGPWADELQGLEGSWPVSVLLEPPETDRKTQKPSWMTGAQPALLPARTFYQGNDGEEELGDKEVQRSVWKADELSDVEAWDSEWKEAGSADVLLAGSDDAPLIHRVTHPKFAGSQILIVVNGAPFLNGSIVQPLHSKISELVIRECLPAKRVAMIHYDESGLLINNLESGGETDFGIQLLTVWPLSAITMHSAFLGIIAFAVLLPILGRPQKLQPRSVTDFGLHVEAMGRMLFEARDLKYGLKSIADYFVKVRRDNPPDWVLQLEQLELAKQTAKEEANLKKIKPDKNASAAGPTQTEAVATLSPPIPAADPSKPTNTPPPDALS